MSVFALQSGNMGRWQAAVDGASYSHPEGDIAVIAAGGGRVGEFTSDARLTVVDPARRCAAACESAALCLPAGETLKFGSCPFLAW